MTSPNVLTARAAEGIVLGVSFMQRLESRWDARQVGLESLTVSTSTSVRASRQAVWEFLTAVGSSMLIDPGVVKTFRVPDTPVDAVGAQHCTIMEIDGRWSAQISEIVAIEQASRIVSRWLTTPTETVTTWTLEPKGAMTQLTYQIGLRIGLGTRKKLEPLIRKQADEALRRIRAAVQSGASFPTD